MVVNKPEYYKKEWFWAEFTQHLKPINMSLP